jgi:hypothetical protein
MSLLVDYLGLHKRSCHEEGLAQKREDKREGTTYMTGCFDL